AGHADLEVRPAAALGVVEADAAIRIGASGRRRVEALLPAGGAGRARRHELSIDAGLDVPAVAALVAVGAAAAVAVRTGLVVRIVAAARAGLAVQPVAADARLQSAVRAALGVLAAGAAGLVDAAERRRIDARVGPAGLLDLPRAGVIADLDVRAVALLR